jgi:transcriptional regulator with XRE-family HTH domain
MEVKQLKLTLKAARVNKGLSQYEAAKMLNISKYTLYNYEKKKTYPPVDVIKKMEILYGVSYNDINFFC